MTNMSVLSIEAMIDQPVREHLETTEPETIVSTSDDALSLHHISMETTGQPTQPPPPPSSPSSNPPRTRRRTTQSARTRHMNRNRKPDACIQRPATATSSPSTTSSSFSPTLTPTAPSNPLQPPHVPIAPRPILHQRSHRITKPSAPTPAVHTAGPPIPYLLPNEDILHNVNLLLYDPYPNSFITALPESISRTIIDFTDWLTQTPRWYSDERAADVEKIRSFLLQEDLDLQQAEKVSLEIWMQAGLRMGQWEPFREYLRMYRFGKMLNMRVVRE